MKNLKKENDKLWAECIKARAGYMSELSKQIGYLQAHHILGKKNYSLRYDLDNGICLTYSEHIYGIHNQSKSLHYLEQIKAVIGRERWERLNKNRELKKETLQVINEYLRTKLKEFKNESNNR